MTLRPATREELAPYAKEGYETAGFILEPTQTARSADRHRLPIPDSRLPAAKRPRGQIFLSRAFGQVFGHNTWCDSPDPRDAARLWLAARKKAREWGAKEVWIHFDGSEPKELVDFWTRLGFKPAMVMYRGSVGIRER